MKKITTISSIAITLTIVLCCYSCNANNSPEQQPANSNSFRSDEFYLKVKLPAGWAAAEGPEYLAKPFDGQVAFNSWGQDDFWATEVCIDNTPPNTSYRYSPQTIMSQIPKGGAYVALVRIYGPPREPDDFPIEYELNDLSGLWQPHDCRQDAESGAQFIEFFKWGRDLQLVVCCHPKASDETATELNNLLLSWKFDSIPVGDIGWACIQARQFLPEVVQPLKFGIKSGKRSDNGIIRITQAEVQEDTVKIKFLYLWNVPPPPRTVSYECSDDSCHWWEINVISSGEVVLVDEGGATLPLD